MPSHSKTPSDAIDETCEGKGESLLESLVVTSHGIFKPGTALEITIKSIRDIEDPLDMLHAQWLMVVDSQGLRCSDGVFDLFEELASHLSIITKGNIPVDHSDCS